MIILLNFESCDHAIIVDKLKLQKRRAYLSLDEFKGHFVDFETFSVGNQLEYLMRIWSNVFLGWRAKKVNVS